MIEVTIRYQLLPTADDDDYWQFLKNRLPAVFRAEDLVEIKAHRDLVVPELVRITLVWQSVEAWARFAESESWRTIMREARQFGEDFESHIWIASDYVPEPIRL